MRLTDLFHLAEKYLILGMIAVGLIVGIFCIWYFILYRRLLHGTDGFPLKKLAATALILCYLVIVLGAVMLDRSSIWQASRAVLYPFQSYLDAWYSFSGRAWRNLILNICMFVPLGLLLPFYSRRFQKAVPVYLAGLGFTLVIELAQLLLKRGIFETDDILNNTLGTMIGYGLFRLLQLFYSRIQAKNGASLEQPSALAAALYQLPLVLTALLFGTIFTVYQMQEFGNLREHYIHRFQMSAVDLSLEAQLSDSPQSVPVYRMQIADKTQTRALAQDLFAALGTRIDDSETQIYDETAIYWDTDRTYSVWIDFAGCPMRFTDFGSFPDEADKKTIGKPGCSQAEICAALEKLGVTVPDSAAFSDLGDGAYRFEVDTLFDERLVQGTLSCTYNQGNQIHTFHNAVITYEKACERPILSEQEAFRLLQDGKFRADHWKDGTASVIIHAVRLHYVADSKGFYQPVYAFDASIDGEQNVIEIPALP